MTPVTHDSPDWQRLIERVGALEREQGAMNADLSHLVQQQKENHKDNQESIAKLELFIVGDEETPGLKTLMYTLNNNMSFIKWIGVTMVGFVLSCAVALFLMWAQGHHITSNDPPAIRSMNQPQDAAIPPLRR